MRVDHLGAAGLRAVVDAYNDALAAHREPINRLNVYPVPDGDTGTNMSLTLGSVTEALGGVDDDLAAVCKAVSHGSLMGARGNSGVILSQVLRGFVGVVAESGGLDGAGLARALRAASDAAYEAVMRPVEGTILTVVRESAEAAEEAIAADPDADLVSVLATARERGEKALAGTPELLPVLAEAGVVDAGGTGYLLLLDALLHVADGRPVPEPRVGEGAVRADARLVHAAADEHGDGSGLRYEVMYFLEAPDEAIPAFKDVWSGIGDSIVVVGGDGLWNCHIHTDDIGAAVEAAVDAGRPRKIRVTDLAEQVEEERWVREAAGTSDVVDLPPHASEPVRTAVVAVAAGDGIKRIFYSLGVQGIVAGGQSMNPSTAELLAAVEAVPADEVVILPNNKNIIPVAEQVDAHTDRAVRVVPTRGIAEGFAALMSYDPEAGADENAKEMTALASNVLAGEVTRAVRDSTSDVGPIAEGDYLGITSDGILAVEQTAAAAACRLLDRLVTDEHEIVTVIEGEGSTPADTRAITEWLDEHHPAASVEIHHGGQPLYPYLFGIE
ncbi:MAG TPA: DAK2 domain-containing protein [Acidimicrobiales bacterium]|nr:DAK2 domain-containing protein [Acidimicrobiales bacterium]